MNKILKFDIKLQRKEFLLDVQATISSGITGVYGPSGHGKTSLLNSVAGLIKPDSGCITICDEKVFDSKKKINLPVQKRNVGYVFQDIRLFPHLTIEKNLKYGIKKGVAAEIDFKGVVDILQVEHLLAKKPSECSGGEKQRIAIGRALLSGARILLMDEPFSAVDVNLRNNIIPFLKAINLRFKIPMLVVSHDLPDLLSLTSDLLLLKDGKVKALGRFQDLILDETNLEIMKGAGLYNVFDLCVFETLPSRGMVLLRSKTSDFQVQVLPQMLNGEVKKGVPVKVLIRPEDISIALYPIDHISLRNQLKGTIEKIFSRNGLSFCLVEAGEKVLVEITEASRKNMQLEVGKTVYCLFKSAALKIF
ncbi:molybdenum ABC transporter ATP-binding protein [Maribellus sp. YY47]|uniref:molybdenum ABC transporter ATP-binding protein n=1 Tax=Maribellus sp. YY47 TaxID=2929486 RepID=UPI002000F4F5|nr:molybdenum ABC transporter ATP-binding protein [Maribellus sp. YY47]MCK3686422.1 molybdenum ABC transporter ATP-binding protein [Maribellus sp. YY47]